LRQSIGLRYQFRRDSRVQQCRVANRTITTQKRYFSVRHWIGAALSVSLIPDLAVQDLLAVIRRPGCRNHIDFGREQIHHHDTT